MGLIDDLFRDFDRRARMGARPPAVLLDPGAWVVLTYRLGRALPPPVAFAMRGVHRLLERATSSALPFDAEIGGGLYLPHRGHVRVGRGARIGRDCNLSRGAVVRGGSYVGDRVFVGPGARVDGAVRIGNDAALGKDVVVREDVPDGGAVGGERAIVIPGRRRPELSHAARAVVRALLPKPAQLLVRVG